MIYRTAATKKRPAPPIVAAAVLVLLALPAAELPAFDILEWVETSDRDLNPAIANLILTEDSETALRLLRALGSREDPYVEDIIEAIFFQHSADGRHEFFLEVLFSSALSAYQTPERRFFWAAQNRPVLGLLLARLPHLGNAFLKAQLITLLPYTGASDSVSHLISEGEALAEEMKRRQGFLPPGRLRETVALLDTVQGLGDPEFLPLCLSLQSGSRQSAVVSRAREAIRVLRDLVD